MIDQNIRNQFEVACRSTGKRGTSFNCTYHTIGVTQMCIFLPYDNNVFVGIEITFTLAYDYLSCSDNREINFTGDFKLLMSDFFLLFL